MSKQPRAYDAVLLLADQYRERGELLPYGSELAALLATCGVKYAQSTVDRALSALVATGVIDQDRVKKPPSGRHRTPPVERERILPPASDEQIARAIKAVASRAEACGQEMPSARRIADALRRVGLGATNKGVQATFSALVTAGEVASERAVA